MRSEVQEIKVSATDWLCVKVDSRWIPVTKLTPEQVRDVVDVMKTLQEVNKAG